MEAVFVSVGSNVDRARNIPGGLLDLRARFGPLSVSTVYECPAVGFDGDDFLNLVVAFDSREPVESVHAGLRAIEEAWGRDRNQPKFSPRTLDLDLLLYGARVLDTGPLVLPRPEIERVAFVLCPLAELAMGRVHPVRGLTFTELWARFDGIGAHDLVPVADTAALVPATVYT